jgi:hypothetical protein
MTQYRLMLVISVLASAMVVAQAYRDPPAVELEKAFAVNAEKRISFDEYLELAKLQYGASFINEVGQLEVAHKEFAELDTNHDGFLSFDEFRVYKINHA